MSPGVSPAVFRRDPIVPSYLLALPAVLYVLVFSYCTYPYLLMAFQKFEFGKSVSAGKWTGFGNFGFFFRSNAAFTVTWNTLKLNTLFILFGTIASILLALAL